MQKTLIAILTTLSLATISGQACGVYKIRFVGKISGFESVKSVLIPTTAVLHGLERINPNNKWAYREFEVSNGNIDILNGSHMSCHVTATAENLFTIYKLKNKHLTIYLIEETSKGKRRIPLEIEFDKIAFKEFGATGDPKITLDLGVISYTNQ